MNFRKCSIGVLFLGVFAGGAEVPRDILPAPGGRWPGARIAFTFDDGPHPAHTKRLLSILAREKVPATFFVVGKQAERFPWLLKAIDKAGHEVANHTYDHPNLTKLSQPEVAKELETAGRVLESILQKKPRFFRPPGGQYNQNVLDEAEQMGYQTVLWTVFPRDHDHPDPGIIYERILSGAGDGAVVLLHSGIEETLEVLPAVIDALKTRGYRFLTVSQMLDEKNPPDHSIWYLAKRP